MERGAGRKVVLAEEGACVRRMGGEAPVHEGAEAGRARAGPRRSRRVTVLFSTPHVALRSHRCNDILNALPFLEMQTSVNT